MLVRAGFPCEKVSMLTRRRRIVPRNVNMLSSASLRVWISLGMIYELKYRHEMELIYRRYGRDGIDTQTI